jgi:hypothetical protein
MSRDVRKVITLSFLLHPGRGGGKGVLLSGSPSGFGGHTILDIMFQENPEDFKKNQATLNLFACLVFTEVMSLFFWHVVPHHWVISSRCFETRQLAHIQGSKFPRRILGH